MESNQGLNFHKQKFSDWWKLSLSSLCAFEKILPKKKIDFIFATFACVLFFFMTLWMLKNDFSWNLEENQRLYTRVETTNSARAIYWQRQDAWWSTWRKHERENVLMAASNSTRWNLYVETVKLNQQKKHSLKPRNQLDLKLKSPLSGLNSSKMNIFLLWKFNFLPLSLRISCRTIAAATPLCAACCVQPRIASESDSLS